MKHVSISFSFEDKEYMGWLIKRFTELVSGIEISLHNPDADIEIVDSFKERSEKKIYVLDEEREGEEFFTFSSSAKEILDCVLKKAEKIYMKYLPSFSDGKKRVISVKSVLGGVGKTSLSISIAAKMRGKTLLLTRNKGNIQMYFKNLLEANLKPYKQFQYLRSKERKVEIEGYILRDRFSFDLLLVDEKCEELLQYILLNYPYENIVTDLDEELKADIEVYVLSEVDKRTFDVSEGGILVRNMAKMNMLKDGEIYIPYCPDEFMFSDGYIEMASDGEYSRGIDNVVNEIYERMCE